jgi:hypothetical protein
VNVETCRDNDKFKLISKTCVVIDCSMLINLLFKCVSSFSGNRVAQSIKRRFTGWTTEVRFPVGAKDFYLHNGSGTHPVTYTVSTMGFSQGVKRPGREAKKSNAEVNNA